jgi:hypothetical protein
MMSFHCAASASFMDAMTRIFSAGLSPPSAIS